MTESYQHSLRLFAVPGSSKEAQERSRIERSLVTRLAARSLCAAVSATENSKILSAGIFDTLAEWACKKPHFWSREIGHLCQAVQLGNLNDITNSLVANAIQASVSGVKGSWSFSLIKPKSLRVFSVVLDSVRSGYVKRSQETFFGEFNVANGRILIEANDRQCIVKQSSDGHERNLVATSINIFGDQYYLVPSLLASIHLLPEHGQLESEYDDELVGAGAEPSVSAFRLLHRYWLEGYNWVSSVIREIVPLRSKKSGVGSSSSFWDCGTIAATLRAHQNPALLSEIFVHEASHQHFFLAKQIGPLDDGSDKREYFSPMVNAPRSLEKMLLGYHALINMLIFYSIILMDSDKNSDSFVVSRAHHLFKKLKAISPFIGDATAFTQEGGFMLQRLREEEKKLRAYFSS